MLFEEVGFYSLIIEEDPVGLNHSELSVMEDCLKMMPGRTAKAAGRKESKWAC